MTVQPGSRTPAFDLVCLSPHYDDAVFSCGGLLHRAARAGRRALAVTICAAPPPDGAVSPYAARLHARWGGDDAAAAAMVARRRAEDEAALGELGVATAHLDFQDAIYRRDPVSGAWLYQGHEGIFGPLAAAEGPIVEALATRLRVLAGVGRATRRLAPLSVGGHVDHRLARLAAEQAWGETGLRYYEDFPYAAEAGAVAAHFGGEGSWRGRRVALDEADLAAKIAAVACYRSQISTFWEDHAAMAATVRAFAASRGHHGQPAERLWRRAGTTHPA